MSSLREEEKTDPVVLEFRFAAPATEMLASFSIMRGIPALVDGEALQESVDVTQKAPGRVALVPRVYLEKARRLVREILDRSLVAPTARYEFEALEVTSSQSEGATS